MVDDFDLIGKMEEADMGKEVEIYGSTPKPKLNLSVPSPEDRRSFINDYWHRSITKIESQLNELLGFEFTINPVSQDERRDLEHFFLSALKAGFKVVERLTMPYMDPGGIRQITYFIVLKDLFPGYFSVKEKD